MPHTEIYFRELRNDRYIGFIDTNKLNNIIITLFSYEAPVHLIKLQTITITNYSVFFDNNVFPTKSKHIANLQTLLKYNTPKEYSSISSEIIKISRMILDAHEFTVALYTGNCNVTLTSPDSIAITYKHIKLNYNDRDQIVRETVEHFKEINAAIDGLEIEMELTQ